MSFALAATLLMLVALGAVAMPLLRGRAAPMGRGLEDAAPVHRWQAERGRLISQLRDNDLALAEGRIGAETHRHNATRLGAEAEAAVAALRSARAELAGDGMQPRLRPHPAATAAGLGLVVLVTLAAMQVARWQDIDLTGSPHADGRIPLDIAAAPDMPAMPPLLAGAGAPSDVTADDIAAMVAGLEARVDTGGAGADEIKMLLRSYDTLGRMDDARAVLGAALLRFPDDTDFQLGYLRAVIDAPDGRLSGAALPDALAVAERLVAALPDLMEARWYRSLLLVRAGRRDEARTELMWMTPHLPPASPAGQAVAALLAELTAAGAASQYD